MPKVDSSRIRHNLFTKINLLLLIAILGLGIPGAWRTSRAFLQVPEQIDFAAYYLAAAMLNSGDTRIYDSDALARTAAESNVVAFGPFYLYPPLFAGLLRPLASLPYDTAKGLWFAANIGLLIGSAFLLMRIAGRRIVPTVLIASFGVVALFPPVHQALVLGQVSPLLLFLISGSIAFALRSEQRRNTARDFVAGFFLALATHVKVVPGLLIPYPAITQRRRLFAWALVWLLVGGLIGVILGGGINNTLYYAGPFLPSLYQARFALTSLDNQSLSACIMRILTPTSVTVSLMDATNLKTIALQSLANNPALATTITYVLTTLILAGTCIAILHIARIPSHLETIWPLGFALLVLIPLIVSSAWYHLYVILLPVFAILLRYSATSQRPFVATVALSAYLLVLVQRYSNWIATYTASPFLVSWALYAGVLLWGMLVWLCCSRQSDPDAGEGTR